MRLSPRKSYCCGCDSGQQQLDFLGLRLHRKAGISEEIQTFHPGDYPPRPQRRFLMREFMMLISEILFIVILQTVIEAIFDMQNRKEYAKVVNIACVLICYFLLIRYVYNHLLGEFTALINYTF